MKQLVTQTLLILLAVTAKADVLILPSAETGTFKATLVSEHVKTGSAPIMSLGQSGGNGLLISSQTVNSLHGQNREGRSLYIALQLLTPFEAHGFKQSGYFQISDLKDGSKYMYSANAKAGSISFTYLGDYVASKQHQYDTYQGSVSGEHITGQSNVQPTPTKKKVVRYEDRQRRVTCWQCEGKGIVQNESYNLVNGKKVNSKINTFTCRGCKGKGTMVEYYKAKIETYE